MHIKENEWNYLVRNGHISDKLGIAIADGLLSGDKAEQKNSLKYKCGKALDTVLYQFLRSEGYYATK